MILSHLLYSCLYGLNHNNSFPNTSIASDAFSKHYLIHRIFNSFGTLIILICLYKYSEFNSKSELNPENDNKEKNKEKNRNKLIFHNSENKFLSNEFILFYFLIIFCWVLVDDIIENYIAIFQDLDFWMFELITLSYFSIKIFKYELYKHRFLAISLCIFSSLLKIGCIMVTFFGYKETAQEENNYTGGLKILYKNKPGLTIPLGIILYIILITLRSYISWKLKWYMDIINVSHIKLFIIYGVFSIIIYTIISLIGTFIDCFDLQNLEISKYMCKVELINNKNNTIYHLEDFKIYFDNFKNENILREIIVIILGIISFFFKKYFSILIIKDYSPIYVIISIPILYLLQKVVMFFNTLFSDESFFNCKNKCNKNKIIKFSFDIYGDLFSFIGFLIYLEKLVIKGWNLDQNIQSNMKLRSFSELKISDEERFSGSIKESPITFDGEDNVF